jgi:hypothetical protein
MTRKEWKDFVDGTPVTLSERGCNPKNYNGQKAFIKDKIYYKTRKVLNDWLHVDDNELGAHSHGWYFSHWDIVENVMPAKDLYKALGMHAEEDTEHG